MRNHVSVRIGSTRLRVVGILLLALAGGLGIAYGIFHYMNQGGRPIVDAADADTPPKPRERVAEVPDAQVQELRTQKIGDTVYFEATLRVPADLRMPAREGNHSSLETVRRTLAGRPRLLPRDRAAADVGWLAPPEQKAEEKTLIFLGKVRGDGPARLRLLYPTGTTAAAGKGSLLEPYVRAPVWGEARVTLDFAKAQQLDSPHQKRLAKQPLEPSDLEGRWAQAQTRELAVWETQAADFGFYHFARQALARKYQVPAPDPAKAITFPEVEEHKHLYEMTTGGATLAEALAQERMRSDKAANQPRTRDIQSLPQITLTAHPWERMIGDRTPAPEPLARWVPEDNYYATAHGIRAYLDLAQLLDQWGGSVLHAFELTARDEQVRARYEKQLCLPAEQVAKKVDAQLVRDLAVTGSDLYWREGSDVSVLFHVTDSKRFLESVDPFLQEARKEFGAQLTASQSKHRNVDIESYVTPLREISLHRAAVENAVIYSNSLAALQRILDVHDDPAHSLEQVQDFRYMRTVFRREDKDEDGFAFLSDAFIRRLLSPASKIKEQRRLQALASLILAQHAALFHAWETGRLPANQKELLAQAALDGTALRDPEGEEVTWNAERKIAVSKVYGTRHFLTPLVELSIDRVTAEEDKDYRQFVQEYQRLWQNYLDPAGLRLALRGGEVRVETHILPVVRTQGYDFLRQLTGGRTTTFDLSRLSPRTLAQLLSTFDSGFLERKSKERGEAWAVFALEDSPAYRTLIELWLKHEFQANRDNELARDGFELLPRLPLTFGLHLPDDKDGSASAEQGQILLQILSSDSAETVHPYQGAQVKKRRVQNRRWGVPPGAEPETILLYHARIDDAWYASFSEEALHRLIDQALRRRENKAAPRKIEVATSLLLAPEAMQQAASAIFGFLEWEGHRRALANGPAWYALYRSGLLAADADEAAQRTAALHHLGFVPVSPDGFAYRFDADRDEVANVRHGSYSRPRLGDGLDERSAGRQVLGSLRSLRVDLRFREDGVQTVLTFDRKSAEAKPQTLTPAHPAIFRLGGLVERMEGQADHPLLRVDLAGTRTGDADLAELKNVPGLHTLNLNDTAVTDAGLKYLRDLPELREVFLDTPGVRDAGAAALNDRKSLRIHRRTDKERFFDDCWGLGGKGEGDALNLAGTKITDTWLERLKIVPDLKKLNLARTPITDAGLVHLKQAKQLRSLILDATHVTSAGLHHLKALPELEHLSLNRTNLGAEAIAALKDLPHLERLELDNTSLGNADVPRLRELTRLRRLHLDTPGLDDAGAAQLAKDGTLQVVRRTDRERFLEECVNLGGKSKGDALDLTGTAIKDAWLAKLKVVPDLKRLNLRSTPVTDAGLAHLAVLKELQVLDLTGTHISNAGLKHLHGLQALQRIHLEETAVTDRGAEELRRALPGLKTIARFTDHELILLDRLKRSVALLNGRVELKESETGRRRVKVVLDRSKIKGYRLADLDGLALVQELDLWGIEKIEDGITELEKAAHLRSLNLSRTDVTSSGLRALQNLTELRELSLAHTLVFNMGLAHLKTLSKLERLNLSGTDIGDDGIAHLKGLTQLRELDLDFTRITDDSLPSLRGLTRLEKLHVRGTRLTPAGINALERALPRTKVIRN